MYFSQSVHIILFTEKQNKNRWYIGVNATSLKDFIIICVLTKYESNRSGYTDIKRVR